MTFIKNADLQSHTKDSIKSNIIFTAYLKILTYSMKAADIELDQYFKKNKKKSLKSICIEVLKNATFNFNLSGQVEINFKNKKIDNLAAFITYGDNRYFGSKILINAFK